MTTISFVLLKQKRNIRHCEEAQRADEANLLKLKNMTRDKKGYVYMMTNPGNTVVYTGVTGDLKKRVWEHKQKMTDGFAQRYNATSVSLFRSV